MDLDREREDWDLLADDLGLVFDAGLKPFLESSAAKRLIVESEIKENPNTEQALAVLENSDIQKLLENVFLGACHGESDGFQFYVYRTVKSGNGSGVRRYRTNIALLFNEPLGLDLVTYPEGFFEKIGKTIFGLQDIILGNPELDAKIMVKGSSESEIQCRFSNEELLETILGLYKECPATRIDDYGIRVREIGRIVDAEKAKKIMSLLAQTAKGIEASK